MKIIQHISLIDDGHFSKTSDFQKIIEDIYIAVEAIKNPLGSNFFTLNPTKKGNGVTPIKDRFIEVLDGVGWQDEKKIKNPDIKKRKIDTSILNSNGKYFGAEWETGNISSSHRAINRLKKGILENALNGGILVLPSRKTYTYLTDRIGNFQELEPYFEVMADTANPMGYLGVIEIEHDYLSSEVPLIKKGTDGRALR